MNKTKTFDQSCGCLERGQPVRVDNLALMNRADAEHAIRQGVQHVYLGSYTALTRILGSYKFYVDTRDVGFGGHVLLDGYWEMWLTLFCARNVRSGMTAIDVGANMGYYTVLFGSNVGPQGRVLAVEPNPRAAVLLRRSIDINGYTARTQVEEVACGDGSSTIVQLVIPETEPKNAYVSPDGTASSLESIDRACVTLDDLCAAYDRVDFIKIDAEGSEERIFAGMAGILKRQRPVIVVEVNIARYVDPAEFLNRLSAVYGRIWNVSYDGEAVPITVQQLLSTNVGEDWLVVLTPDNPA